MSKVSYEVARKHRRCDLANGATELLGMFCANGAAELSLLLIFEIFDVLGNQLYSTFYTQNAAIDT